MSDIKFSIPEIKKDRKKVAQWRKEALDAANLDAPLDTAYLPPRVSAIIFTMLSVSPLFACYIVASLPIFLLAVIVWIIAISAFWRKRNEAEKLEKMDVIPAEELILNDNGFHWKKMSGNSEVLDIGWDDFEIISFDPLDYYLKVKKKSKTKQPRIMHDEKIRSQIIKFIEQNTKLIKTVQNKQWRDEDYVVISFTHP
jgi:hypothetical protein